MNQRIKKLWIKALRSGKYKQGQDQLRVSNGEAKFCCLGVLCDIHSRSKSGRKWRGNLYMSRDLNLPLTVMRWAGLKQANPRLRTTTAASLNDNGRSFDFIADRIEKYL